MKVYKFCLILSLLANILIAPAFADDYNVNSPHVIVNQIFGGDGGYVSHNFIELYNPTDSTVNLNGWAIHYRSSQADKTKASSKWNKLDLSGEIPSHHSYLIQCAKDPNFKASEYPNRSIAGDIQCEISIYNKGVSVILTSNNNEIKSDAQIFDNTSKTPVLPGYVDMLAASGNDGTTEQIPPAYETSYSKIQSKKKAIRRNNFQDTDNNKNDCKAVDYENYNVSKYFPRNLSSGAWGYGTYAIIDEIQEARANIPRFYENYCDSESANALKNFLAGLDAKLEDKNISSEELDSLLTKLKTLAGNLKFLSDSVVPRIFIATDKGNGQSYGTSLVKSIGYVPAQIAVVNIDGSFMAKDLDWEAQIKVHGNYTSGGAKRPYNLKFSSKVDLFNFGKAKKWILLADYYDPTLMRNKIALDLGAKIGLTSTMANHRVEIYVDGSYRGLYLLTEKIEADKNRVDIDTDKGDFLVEMEIKSRVEKGNVYISTSAGRFFRLREPEDESQIKTITSKLDEFENTLKEGNWEKISAIIDLDSFVAYYIHNEFMKPIDFWGLSVYFYYHDGKFYAGPVWDYDFSAGDHSSTDNTKTLFAANCHYYAYLTKIPEFNSAVIRKFAKISDTLGEIYSSGGWIDSDAATYADAINRNYKIWKFNGNKNIFSTYEKNIDFLKNWLKEHHEWLTQYFLNGVCYLDDGIYYYVKGERTPAGFVTYNKEKYFAGEGGKISTGFFEYEGSYYFADEAGKILTGQFEVNDLTYNSDSDGKILPKSLKVEISGQENLTLDVGDKESITFTETVSSVYDSPELQDKVLESGKYSLSWTLDKNISGISISNGVLTVNENAPVGNYELTITALAKSEALSNSAEKKISIEINNVAPVIEVSQKSITVAKLQEIRTITITAIKGTYNLEWLTNGSLPSGIEHKIDGNKFIIYGTPDEQAEAKVYEFTVTAKNEIDEASEKISFTINDSNVVIAKSYYEFTAYKGKETNFAITIVKGENISWSCNGTLPAGLEFTHSDSGAQISGTPKPGTSGTYEIEITASNSYGDSSNAAVKIFVLGSLENDNQSGESDSPVTGTTSSGQSFTSTHTVFKNAGGVVILSADVSIIAPSDEFKIFPEENFSQNLNVYVNLELSDSDYDKYYYSMDITGLPEWLSASGELLSSDKLSTGTREFNHAFKISGQPLTLHDKQAINFKAIITVSGDDLPLEFYADKDINISVIAKPAPTPAPGNNAGPAAPIVINEEQENGASAPAPEESSDVKPKQLNSINALLSGNTSITLKEGESGSLVINALVSASYSDGTRTNLSNGEYSSSWSASSLISGISFNNGVLSITGSARAGSYNIPVRFSASFENAACEASITLNVNITASGNNGNFNENPEKLSDLISEMSNEEIQQVTNLTLGENVTDLSGIENFTNLEELDLSQAASLETIDLSGNTSIKHVEVTGNTSLTSLNLSGSSIEILDAQNCENLNELNIEGCKNLKSLNVSGTALTSLNAKDCANLQELDFASCNVSELNLEGCTSLEYLNCKGNALTKLDASIFPVLQELLCANQSVNNWKSSKVFSAEINSDSSRITNLKAWDSKGNEIATEYDSETEQISFTREPAKISYEYITGFENIKMDVVIHSASSTNDSESISSQSGGSGGCNSGLNVLAVILCLTVLCRRR